MSIIPFKSGYLDEQEGHKIYYAQYGNAQGEPIVVLHGGPGSKSKPKHAARYNLKKYHIVTFDQRGCGKSTPAGETQKNTLQGLLIDIERLRQVLRIDRWYVAGGSWGSTLALAYAQMYPQHVKGLLLSSMFLGRPRDVAWAFSEDNGVSRFFPDLWEKRLEFLRNFNTHPKDAAKVLLERMREGNLETIQEIVAGVNNWEGNLMNAQEDVAEINPEDVKEETIAAIKIFLHYEANKFFLEDDQLIKNIRSIQDIPTIIVHGRYDLLCPPEQAWEVHKRLTHAEIIILPSSNHKLTADGEKALALAFNNFLCEQS